MRLTSPNLHKKVKLWWILVVEVRRSHRTNRLFKHGTILPFFVLRFLSVFYSVRFVHYHTNCFRPQYHSKNVTSRRNHWRQITLFPECLARYQSKCVASLYGNGSAVSTVKRCTTWLRISQGTFCYVKYSSFALFEPPFDSRILRETILPALQLTTTKTKSHYVDYSQ